MFKAILFDMDGTLLDTEFIYYTEFKKNLQKFGYELTKEQFMAQMGMGLFDGAKKMTENYYFDMSPEEYLEIIDIEGVRDNFKDEDYLIPKMKGFDEILEHFNNKLLYAIGTGSPRNIMEILAHRMGFSSYMSVLVSREDVPKGKPAPDIYLEAARLLGVNIEECIVLEDAPAGVDAGKNAGAYTIAVQSEWTEGFVFNNSDQVCSSLIDVIGHIDALLK